MWTQPQATEMRFGFEQLLQPSVWRVNDMSPSADARA